MQTLPMIHYWHLPWKASYTTAATFDRCVEQQETILCVKRILGNFIVVLEESTDRRLLILLEKPEV